jgi:SAM-dependent methyltransferase
MNAMEHHPPSDHWERHARTWQHFGSPLRPCAADVRWMELALQAIHPGVRQAVLLGVTPELAHMRWPEACQVLAVDQNEEMIRLQWQTNPPANGRVLCGDWQHLPLADGSVDAIVGDGVLVFFAQPDGVRPLLKEFRRLLTPHGRWLLRVFVRPEQGESLEQVHAALANGAISSFHAYKWRLAMALQPSLASGVRPEDVWRAWRQWVPSAAALSAATEWPLAEIDTIEAYRDSQATYYFPTLDELRQLLSGEFEILDLHIPGHELGERCPLLALGMLPA